MRLLYRCHDPHCIRLHKIVEDRKFCFHEIDTATKEPEPPVPDDDDGYEYANLWDVSGNLIKRFRVRKPGFLKDAITADKIQAGSNSVTFRAEQWMLMKIQNPQSFVRIDNVT